MKTDAARIVREHSYDLTGRPRYEEDSVRAAIDSYVAVGWSEHEAVSYVEAWARLGLDLPHEPARTAR
jgi:hypothetical protein